MRPFEQWSLVLNAGTLIVLFFTLLKVRRYTEAASEQSRHAATTAKAALGTAEAAQKPCLAAGVYMMDSPVRGQGHLHLFNVGNGPAINLKWVAIFSDGQTKESFGGIVIERGKSYPTALVSLTGMKTNNPGVDVVIRGRKAMTVTIDYESISKKHYRSVIKLIEDNLFLWTVGSFDFSEVTEAHI